MIVQVVALLKHVLKALLTPLAVPVRAARDVVHVFPGVALLVLGALLVALVLALRGNRGAALALVPLSLAWLVLNAPFEGPTLLVLSWSHGITLSDLLSFAGLGVAAWRLTQAAVALAR